MNNITALIIDDEKNLTRSLTFALKQVGVSSLVAHDSKSGLQLADEGSPDAVLLDVRLGEESGLDVLPILKAALPDVPIIMMSAYGETKDVVQAIKMGAVDYLTKPFDMDELLLLLQENITRGKLKNEVAYFREKASTSGGLIGDSFAVQELSKRIDSVASSAVRTVLLSGETGVGKTLVAREIHNKTVGQSAPFVEINCASLPAELIEAELFGAEKGSYTSSMSRRVGLVEVADKGTLFLDEIGELPIGLQAKLLTFLESWTYRPIGSSRERAADVLVVMATNRDLKILVDNQKFRDDLYFRINTMPINIPSLRERGEDVSLLTGYFVDVYFRREGGKPIVLSDEVVNIFQRYSWPGNIRELKNLIERLTILYSGETILLEHLPVEMFGLPPNVAENGQGSESNRNRLKLSDSDRVDESLIDSERNIILKALDDSQWRKGIAAQKLGISRHALKRRIQRLGLE